MAPRRWGDLMPELLCHIGDRLDLKCYASARGVCTAWRRALVPPSPALLVVAADASRLCPYGARLCPYGARLCPYAARLRPYAASLPTRRSFELTAIVSGSRCVGSSNGWLALRIHCSVDDDQAVFVLLNPITAVEIVLPPLIMKRGNASSLNWVSKVVFTPSPAKDDFAAAAICNVNKIAYVTAGARRWAIIDSVARTASQAEDQLIDVVYSGEGEVYCLTKCGDVHVVRLPERQCRKPANADQAGPSKPEFSALCQPPHPSSPPPPPPVPSLSPLPPLPLQPSQGTIKFVHQKCWQRALRPRAGKPFRTFSPYKHKEYVPPEPEEDEEPHLNAPATVQPLLPLLDRATVFAPPYGTVAAFTSAKNLVFCEGNLYQVWRNASCTVTLQLPAGGHHRVEENEILVLRYYPGRQPCWEAVKDLGGYSFFVGRNNAVSLYAESVPGLRGNCVYWIGGHGKDQGMVFDMKSGRSTPCSAPQSGLLPGGHPHSTICWYFMSDVMSISNSG